MPMRSGRTSNCWRDLVNLRPRHKRVVATATYLVLAMLIFGVASVAMNCGSDCRRSAIQAATPTPNAEADSEQWRRLLRRTCACRKSNPDVLVVQPAENGATKDLPARSTARETGASFSKDRCVRAPL